MQPPRSADWKCRVNLIGLFTTVSHEKGAESVFKKKKGAESRADDKLLG